MATSVIVGQWNMLAYEPEVLPWDIRAPKVIAVLSEMFNEGQCDFVVVVENTRPWEILDKLRVSNQNIQGVAVVDRTRPEDTSIPVMVGTMLDDRDEARTVREGGWRDSEAEGIGECGDTTKQNSTALTQQGHGLGQNRQRHTAIDTTTKHLLDGKYKHDRSKIDIPTRMAASTISIYYDSTKFTLAPGANDPVVPLTILLGREEGKTEEASQTLPIAAVKYFAWTFQRNDDIAELVMIIGAHLSSGGDDRSILRREAELATLGSYVDTVDCAVFLAVDCNDGFTPQDFETSNKTLSDLGFADGLGATLQDEMDGYFKMRHVAQFLTPEEPDPVDLEVQPAPVPVDLEVQPAPVPVDLEVQPAPVPVGPEDCPTPEDPGSIHHSSRAQDSRIPSR